MDIDAPTLIVMTSGIAAISAACTGAEWWRGREAAPGAWSLAFALISLGCAISMTRLSGFYFLGIWFTHGMLVLAHALLLKGSLALAGRQAGWWWLVGLPLWAVCLALPADFGSAPVLVAVNSATVGLYALGAAVVLLGVPGASATLRLMGWVFALHAGAYAVRVGLVGSAGAFVNVGRFEGFAISAMLFEGILVLVALTVLMVSVTRERREASLAVLAQTDPLTGALNRRAFVARAGLHLRPGRAGAPATSALLVFDLDNFKALNDAHGHALGDTVLQEFSALAQRELPRGAVFARLGGEEFAALLPGTSLADAEAQAWAIVHRFAEACAVVGGRAIGATVSVGAAAARAGESGVEAMIEAADGALYTAKRRGRNQVRTAGTIDEADRRESAEGFTLLSA